MTSAEPVVARPSSVVGEAMPWTRRLILVVPLIGFLGLAPALAWGMSRNPTAIPSALIGKAVPQFSLPPVKGRTLGLSSADLNGQVSLINVFASWCVACREEHPDANESR